MHDDAVHEVSKAPGTELSDMVVAVVKCKLVELCLTSCLHFGICAWEAETSRTVVVNKNLIKLRLTPWGRSESRKMPGARSAPTSDEQCSAGRNVAMGAIPAAATLSRPGRTKGFVQIFRVVGAVP